MNKFYKTYKAELSFISVCPDVARDCKNYYKFIRLTSKLNTHINIANKLFGDKEQIESAMDNIENQLLFLQMFN